MNNILIFKIVLSFVFAGTTITCFTLLAERFGSKAGGMISMLPSTMLIGTLFFAWTQGKEFAAQTMISVPVGIIIDIIFLMIYIISMKRGIVISSVISISLWIVFALLFKNISTDNILITLGIYSVMLILGVYVVEKILHIPMVSSQKKRYSPQQILFRAVFAGSIVSITVFLSSFASPYTIGILTNFPAVMFSSMIILYKAQGREFAQATAKIMILSSSNLVIFGTSIYLLYPMIGVLFGTIIAYSIAILYTIGLYPFIKKLS